MSVENAQITETTVPVEVKTTTVIDVPLSDPVVINNTTAESPEDYQRTVQISAFLSDPIGYITEFLTPYKPIFIAIGWVLLAIVGFKLVLTFLSAILSVATSIPVLSPLFELIGVIYTGWFIYSHLLTVTQRREFSQNVSRFKRELFGEIADALDTDETKIS